ncbi:hypothetical protein SH661x_002536 [Planctomicrobium sp. SH661]|uniref:hypothetical protein n=1 Tax=Planctomicrobium sp. SH661 TaxID=3448124 RepID=UPI003F5BD247
MTDNYLDRLIQGHFDHALTESEQLELESMLSQSEGARKRFWRLAEVHGLAAQAVRIAFPDREEIPATQLKRSKTSAGDRLLRVVKVVAERSISALGIGIGIGILMTGVAWAIAGGPRSSSRTVLLMEGFESGPPPSATEIPSLPDRWEGDVCEIVQESFGVRPFEGQQMLRYLSADYPGKPNSAESYYGDIYRLVDLRSYRKQSQGEPFMAQFAARFNTYRFPDDEDYSSTVGIYALSSETVSQLSKLSAGQLRDHSDAATFQHCRRLDRDPATWEQVQCELRIPEHSDYLLLHCSVAHVLTSNRRTTFDAHFADDLQLSLTAIPDGLLSSRP